jgi:hypothetical protein
MSRCLIIFDTCMVLLSAVRMSNSPCLICSSGATCSWKRQYLSHPETHSRGDWSDWPFAILRKHLLISSNNTWLSTLFLFFQYSFLFLCMLASLEFFTNYQEKTHLSIFVLLHNGPIAWMYSLSKLRASEMMLIRHHGVPLITRSLSLALTEHGRTMPFKEFLAIRFCLYHQDSSSAQRLHIISWYMHKYHDIYIYIHTYTCIQYTCIQYTCIHVCYACHACNACHVCHVCHAIMSCMACMACMDVWIYGCMDGWMDGCMDARVHALCIHVCIYMIIYVHDKSVDRYWIWLDQIGLYPIG